MNLPLQMRAVVRGSKLASPSRGALRGGKVLPATGVPGFPGCDTGHACMCPGNATDYACCDNGVGSDPARQGEYCTCKDGKPGCSKT